MKRIFSVLCIATVVLAPSCSDSIDNLDGNDAQSCVRSLSAHVEDFLPEEGLTRTNYTVDGNGVLSCTWTSNDTLGIFPVGGDQVQFPISDGLGTNMAKFDGGKWSLRSDTEYSAYYPFSGTNYHAPSTAIPVNFMGQTQDGDGSVNHLRDYDFLAAGVTKPDYDGSVNLLLKHLGCFVRLQLTVPETNTLKTVRVASNNTQFVTTGIVNLSSATPVIVPVKTSSYIELKLEDIAVQAGNVVTLYMMMAPVDLCSSILTFTVVGNGGASYSQTLNAGKNMEAGNAYNYALALDKDDSQYVAVDLGLPSGLKWASFNVGATVPEEYGDYYAWGETETKEYYSQNTYAYFHVGGAVDADGFEMDLWDDLGDISGTEYDVAHQKWGSSWRMPTQSEFQELKDYCTWKWGAKNTVYGYKVTGSNGNWIFLPAAGFRYDSSLHLGGSNGYYWSSTQGPSSPSSAYRLGFNSSDINPGSNDDRFYGQSVRPVTE